MKKIQWNVNAPEFNPQPIAQPAISPCYGYSKSLIESNVTPIVELTLTLYNLNKNNENVLPPSEDHNVDRATVTSTPNNHNELIAFKKYCGQYGKELYAKAIDYNAPKPLKRLV